jgi:acyl-homoserine-lactone acylase
MMPEVVLVVLNWLFRQQPIKGGSLPIRLQTTLQRLVPLTLRFLCRSVTIDALLCLGTLSGAQPDRVRILRDRYGVPHIEATSEEAAAYGNGYAAAEDHLPTLVPLFRRAQGRQAEFFGETFAEKDFMVKRLRIHETAERRFSELPRAVQGILNGYAEGYNRRLAEIAKPPEGGAPITGVDLLAHCRAVLLLDFALDLRLWDAASGGSTPGSNMWAIGKERSANGHGLLLANPHLPWGGSWTFHEVHIHVPGVINIAGGALIGSPFVTIGFNENLGWAHTVNRPRLEDIYKLRVDPANATHYVYDGQSVPFTQHNVEVRVKTAAGIETRSRTFLQSQFGPVLRVDSGVAYAYRSPSLDLVEFLTEWRDMARAHSLAEFRKALEIEGLPMLNIGYADRAGNVFYLYNGRIPRRPDGFDWSNPVSGEDRRTEWLGIHPISELPQLLNPPGGYIQNGNDAPWYTTPHQLIDASKFPKYFSTDSLNLRSQEGVRRLEERKSFTLDEMLLARNDHSLLLARRLRAQLAETAADCQPAEGFAEAKPLIGNWDGRTDVKSRGGVLFERWWALYSRRARPAYLKPWSPAQAFDTPAGLGDGVAACTALRDAAAEVKKEYGRIDPEWGEVHRFRRGELDLPMAGAAGRLGSFPVTDYAPDRDGKLRATGGDGYVLGVEFGNSPRAQSVLAYSESSDTTSPHFNDQGAMFAAAGWKRLWFTDSDIRAHLEREYTLTIPTRKEETRNVRGR